MKDRVGGQGRRKEEDKFVFLASQAGNLRCSNSTRSFNKYEKWIKHPNEWCIQR